MQIHELNTKALTNPAYVPFDDGEDTYKTEFNECVKAAAEAAVAETDLTQNSIDFTSGDAESPTAWTDVPVITTRSTLATLFNRISTMVKNVRYIWSKIGTTDISGIGDGTVTGAINSLDSKWVTMIYTGDLGALSAGASGYITASVTIPSGYITRGIASVALQHPASANGLSINPNVTSNMSGNITFYPTYYAPKAVGNGFADYRIYLLCSRA